MSSQYVFTMYKLSRTHPPDKQVLKDISLSFMPGAKIGVLGVNGSGKSTLLRIMAGQDTEYRGEAQLHKSATVGMLSQEPQLDESKDVRGNVEDGVREIRDLLDRFNELSMNYSDETADEFARLQDRIDAAGVAGPIEALAKPTLFTLQGHQARHATFGKQFVFGGEEEGGRWSFEFRVLGFSTRNPKLWTRNVLSELWPRGEALGCQPSR